MLRPLHDRVAVRREPEETVSKGGIFIPDNAQEKPCRGTVMQVGKGKRDRDGQRITPDVQIGDAILFGKYAGVEIKVNDEPIVLLREDEILAVVE